MNQYNQHNQQIVMKFPRKHYSKLKANRKIYRIIRKQHSLELTLNGVKKLGGGRGWRRRSQSFNRGLWTFLNARFL